MMYTKISKYLEDLDLPSKLPLHELQELFVKHFFYEQDRGMLMLKEDIDNLINISDFKVLLSRMDVSSSDYNFNTALDSEEIEKLRWVDVVIKRLPIWDGIDRLNQMSNCFTLKNESQRYWFDRIFKFWFTKAAEMLAKPYANESVNRLVICLQSDEQSIGKTTFARNLSKPFDLKSNPSYYEMDRPEFTKDVSMENATNVIGVLDDISNWHKGGLKDMKSIISSKTIKLRPPYGKKSIPTPRTASFIATTNEYNFLNEKNDTRWAVFSINSIDFKYEAIDINQIWSQAFYLAKSIVNTEITNDIKNFCIGNSGSHQAVDITAQIVEDWFEVNEDCKRSTTDLFLELPLEYQKLMGGSVAGPVKMGKALVKVFDVKHRGTINGKGKWKVCLKQEQKSS